MTAFATVDDLNALFETEPTGDRLSARLESLLEIAADELRGELRHDYLRNPTSGERTWLAAGEGGCVLHLHDGVISLSLVEISLDRGQTFVALEETDWTLSWDEAGTDEAPVGEPFFHLHLAPYASYRMFPRGRNTVRLTGVSGWATIPLALVEGNAERARQLAFADGSYEGAVSADDEYGRPTVSNRWPDTTWKFIGRERRRFYGCSV